MIAELGSAKHDSGHTLDLPFFRQRWEGVLGLPASHAGVADVSSTLDQLSAMVWIEAIIESMVGPRQTACASGSGLFSKNYRYFLKSTGMALDCLAASTIFVRVSGFRLGCGLIVVPIKASIF
jgi:hypothetical protein